MEKFKGAQELRVDEFSVQKLRERHETMQRLTSQVQELQERMSYLNDSGEFHVVESDKSGTFSHVPSTSKESKSAIYAELRQTLAT